MLPGREWGRRLRCSGARRWRRWRSSGGAGAGAALHLCCRCIRRCRWLAPGVRSLPCCCQWREACLANFQVAPCPGLGCRSLSGPQPFHPWILQLTTTAAACAAAVAAAAAAAGASTPTAQSFDGEGSCPALTSAISPAALFARPPSLVPRGGSGRELAQSVSGSNVLELAICGGRA